MGARIGGLALLAGVLFPGCGRVGYELLPEKTGIVDGGAGGTRGVGLDASLDFESGVPDGGKTTGTGGHAGADNGAHDAGTVDASPSCSLPNQPARDSCLALPALPEAPVLDGKLDCGLTLTPLSPEGWTGPTPADGAPPAIDATAEYAVAWRPDGIYFYVSVTDPLVIDAAPTDAAWKGDSVEFYADSDGTYAAPPAYDDPGTRQFVIAAPTSTTAPPRAEIWVMQTLKSAWQSTAFVSNVRPGGYVVEAFVTAADLGVPSLALATGGHVGIDLAINVSFADPTTTGGSGHRLGQYFLHVTGNDDPFNRVTAFCNPTLQ